MPPRSRWSRNAFGAVSVDTEGRTRLLRRVPHRFVANSDNKVYRVTDQDTLIKIAGKLYGEAFPIPGEQLAWMLADFQPEPILDLTVKLDAGSLIYGPSDSYARINIFTNDRGDRVE